MRCRLFILFLLACNSLSLVYSQQDVSLDSLERFVKSSAQVYPQDPHLYYKLICSVDSVLDQKSSKIKQSEKFKILKGKVKNNQGVYLWKVERLNEGLKAIDSSIFYREQFSDSKGIIQSLANKALIYNDLGDVYTAEETYKSALKYLEKDPNIELEADIYNNLGVLFVGQGMHEKGFEYFSEAIELVGDSVSYTSGVIHNNLGETLIELDSTKKALLHFQKALPIFEEIDNRNGVANALMGYGKIAELEGDMKVALNYFKEALSIYGLTNNTPGKISVYSEISLIKHNLNELDSAVFYANSALELIDNSQRRLTRKRVFEALYKSYQAIGEDSKALKYYQKFNEIQDSLINQEFVRDAMYSESQMKFIAERDSINSAHEKQELILANERKIERQIFIFTIVFILIVLIFLIVSIRGYRMRQALIKENVKQQELINKQLESNLYEKSSQLTKESLKNLKSQKVIDEIDHLIKQSEELNAEEINQNMRTIKTEIVENKLTRKKLDTHAVFLQKENEQFSFNLKKKHPKLTPGDLKLCVLLKNNYSSDEICMILSISTNTFSSSKYRIRRRIGMKKGERLQDYLLSFN